MVWDQRRLRSGREAAPGRLINYREREGRGEEEEDRRGERANEVRSRQRNGPKEKFIAGQGPACARLQLGARPQAVRTRLGKASKPLKNHRTFSTLSLTSSNLLQMRVNAL